MPETAPSQLPGPPVPGIGAGPAGETVGNNGLVRLTLLADEGGRMFKRRAIKKDLRSGAAHRVEWLVAELDGVRVYVNGDQILMTRRDVLP